MTNIIKEFGKNTRSYFEDQKGKDLNSYFTNWSMYEKLWLTLATLAIFIASIMTWDPTNQVASWMALISSITGIWCVILVAKGHISNYIFGLVNVIAYAYSAYLWKIYGDFMLNAFYFLPMQFYGWYIWTKPNYRKRNDNITMKSLSVKSKVIWGAITVVATIGYGFVLKSLGGLTPFFDSMSTVFSIIACILMTYAFLEQWVLWIIVDIVTVIMWVNVVFNEGGTFAAGILVMWCAFLGNAVYGYFNWKKGSKE